jgi:hypothetical protein
VNRPSQLEVGAYYLIKGTDPITGLPFPPQVIQVDQFFYNLIDGSEGYLIGTLWWRMWNVEKMVPNHLIPLRQINLPDQGESDIHLERVPDRIVRQLVGAEGYKEVQQDLLRLRINGRHP